MTRAIDDARESAGIPFVVTSGSRCAERNRKEEGSPDSSHLDGLAVDIKASSGSARWKIINAMIKAGFTRIGVAGSFVHGDVDTEKPEEVIWIY